MFKVLHNGLLRYAYFRHVPTCDYVRVQSATERTASVPVITSGAGWGVGWGVASAEKGEMQSEFCAGTALVSR